jgi:hypothetical protein
VGRALEERLRIEAELIVSMHMRRDSLGPWCARVRGAAPAQWFGRTVNEIVRDAERFPAPSIALTTKR